MKRMMEKLGLKVNEDKMRLCRVPEETFEFLGYSFGRCYSTKTGKVYIGTRPSQKKVKGIMERISQRTGQDTLKQETTEKVRELNALVMGWGNYFKLGPVSKAYRAVDAHCRYRMRQWLCAKHQRQGSWHPSLSGRVSLRDARTGPIGTDNAQPPVGESMNGPWSKSRHAGNPHVRFEERDLETERINRLRARSGLYQILGDLRAMHAVAFA